MTRFATAYAQFASPDIDDNSRKAATKIAGELAGAKPSLVVFFAATNYDPDTLAREMRDAFPGAATFGCTSSGEGIDEKMLRQSVVAMAFAPEVFDHCGMALLLADGPASEADGVFSSVDAAMNRIAGGTGEKLMDLDYRSHVGFILMDSVSRFAEKTLDRIGELTNVLYLGGIAGADYDFTGIARVFYNGKSYRDAAVVCLWKPRDGFGLLKTQAADLTGKIFTVTRADEDKGIIWELDGRDAAVVYAEAIGFPPEKVRDLAFCEFDCNPSALIVDGEPFLRAIVGQVDGKGLRMFAAAKEGQRFAITRVGDLKSTTRQALADKRAEIGDVAAVLHVNCVARCTALARQTALDEFGELFRGAPAVSFSSYGEIYVGLVALTSTMILFK